MTLRLSIENLDRLADGGPLRVEVKGRGLDIGRDSHLDWTLPDPNRIVSGKHCEIRFRDNEYWLLDVSTNGTFVNGASFRIDAPYRLRDSDRLSIGPYVIAVSIEGAPASAPAPLAAASAGDVWGAVGDSAPPEGRDAYRVRKGPATPGDFLDFATDAGAAPVAEAAGSPWGAPPPATDESWLSGPFPPQPAPPPPDPRELPRVERPRPIRPAEAPFSPPQAAPPQAPPQAALPQVPPPQAAPSQAPPQALADAPLLARIAAAAGIAQAAIAGRDAGEIADEIGAVLRLTTLNLIQMAASRRQTKSAIRSSQHTMFQPTANNPIKFAASPEHAMETMFGPPSRIHLKASTAVADAFDELKTHNMLTFGAMQGALDSLFEDLSPDRIEAALPPERGLGAVVASRKGRLWDAYAERWKALTKRADGRLNDAFMSRFAQAYDRLNEKGG